MRHVLISSSLVLLALGAGCSAPTPLDELGSYGEKAPTSPEQRTFTVNDRVSERYETMLVQTGDGTRLSDGTARIRIVDANPIDISLELEASSNGEAWSLHTKLTEQELQAGMDAPRPGLRVERFGRRVPAASDGARLRLVRIANDGKRSALEGSVTGGSVETSATFRAEYSIECMVEPALLGVDANGHADPADGMVRAYVRDDQFRSDFCQRFDVLR